MALMSGKVYSNKGAPSNADGVDGDIYLRLDGMKTTYRKESGAWVAVGSTLGAIPEIISGVGAPSNALGADGQYYRDTGNQNIYYKQGSMWSLVGNLLGAAFTPVLEQAGIGKDLGTFPNLIDSGSLNAVIESGEYYYTNVTDYPTGAPAGFLKVWRLNANNVGQIVQPVIGTGGSIYFRLSTAGVFGSWTAHAKELGDNTKRFQVDTALFANEATRKEQVESMITNANALLAAPRAMGRFKNIAPSPTIQYYNTLNIFSVARNPTGWTVTFDTALASADYIVVGNVSGGGGYGGRSFEPKNQTTSGFDIDSQWGGDNTVGSSTGNGAEVNFVVF